MPKAQGKSRVHITLPEPLLEALEAIALLKKVSLSDIVEDISAAALREMGVLPEITGDQVREVIESNRKSGKKRSGS